MTAIKNITSLLKQMYIQFKSFEVKTKETKINNPLDQALLYTLYILEHQTGSPLDLK